MKRELYDPTFLQRLEKLSLTARRVLGGKVRGERRGRQRGVGVEFRDFRAYVPGDDIRYLDWNVYGRLERLVLKLFVEEEDLSLHLLLDGSASMGCGTPPKFAYALKAAAALAYIALSSHERVTVARFNGGVEGSVGPVRGKGRIFPVLDFLGGLVCRGETRFATAVREYLGKVRMADLVMVMSDFLAAEGFEAGLDLLLSRRCDVVLLHLVTPDELDPPLTGAVVLQDAETGEEHEIPGEAALAPYQKNLAAFFDRVEGFCRHRGIDYLRLSTAVPLEDLILRHLRVGGILG
ncbi:MAG: DUF58 domain-containing protein [Candidatus Methylomirabilales bacterium]